MNPLSLKSTGPGPLDLSLWGLGLVPDPQLVRTEVFEQVT